MLPRNEPYKPLSCCYKNNSILEFELQPVALIQLLTSQIRYHSAELRLLGGCSFHKLVKQISDTKHVLADEKKEN